MPLRKTARGTCRLHENTQAPRPHKTPLGGTESAPTQIVIIGEPKTTIIIEVTKPTDPHNVKLLFSVRSSHLV